jgi:hypothetical protein
MSGHVLLAALMAFTLIVQGVVTQSHFHNPGHETEATSAVTKAMSNGQRQPTPIKLPLNDNPANCPICQQLIHAGQFVAPAWLAPLLLVTTVSRVEIETDTRSAFDTVSHSWLGRGPPQA